MSSYVALSSCTSVRAQPGRSIARTATSNQSTGFSPPRTVGREVLTAAGLIDVLYVSPAGLVTIVETKLWRNPEARREVVGQILDYAKELM